MNKVFFDTEFIEGSISKKGVIGYVQRFLHRRGIIKLPWSIQLVSIGLVFEHGKGIYLLNKDFNPHDADQWVRDNVLAKLPPRKTPHRGFPHIELDTPEWKSLSEIRDILIYELDGTDNEFWTYYAAYDWVVFCSIFGRMIDLPKGYPMFCMDLKQLMESKGLTKEWKQAVCPDPVGEHDALVDAKWNKKLYDIIAEREAALNTNSAK